VTYADNQCCETMRWAISDDEFPVFYQLRWRTWVIEYNDGLRTRRVIDYCPWCGAELPAGLGEERAEEIQRRGLDPLAEDDDLPADLLDDQWWKSRGL